MSERWQGIFITALATWYWYIAYSVYMNKGSLSRKPLAPWKRNLLLVAVVIGAIFFTVDGLHSLITDRDLL